eukprot:3386571-Prymnesium_polylepis.3
MARTAVFCTRIRSAGGVLHRCVWQVPPVDPRGEDGLPQLSEPRPDVVGRRERRRRDGDPRFRRKPAARLGPTSCEWRRESADL